MTVTIWRVVELQDADPPGAQPPDNAGSGDYFPRVRIRGPDPTLGEFQNRPIIQGQPPSLGAIVDGGWTIDPLWSFTGSGSAIDICIEDADALGPPPALDISPVNEDERRDVCLHLILDPSRGWVGPADGTPCLADQLDECAPVQTIYEGSFHGTACICYQGRVYLDLTGTGPIDTDGDGLLDTWEAGGIDLDGQAPVDVPLQSWGAHPGRRDIFVEVDCMVNDGSVPPNGTLTDLVDHSHCPLQLALIDVVTAFANVPGGFAVQLHLDVGALYGPGAVTTVVGAGGFTGTVADRGGGGTQIPEAGNTVIDWGGAAGRPAMSFYTLKAANFNEVRRLAFRYAIFAHQTNARAAVNDCTSGWAEAIRANDFFVSLGGRADLDGNGTPDTTCFGGTPADSLDNDGDGAVDEDPDTGIDNDGDGAVDEDPVDGVDNDGDGTVDEDRADDDGDCAAATDTNGDGAVCGFGDVGVDEDGGHSIGTRNEQGGTFMHELGHALGLGHGGADDVNTKPNYLSVMNYAWQYCGVPPSPAGATAPIPGGCDYSRLRVDLNETSLDECVGLGAALGFVQLDWNGNGVLEGVSNCQPPNSSNVSFDINFDAVCVSAGPNRTLNTPPAGDDVVAGRSIVDGANRTCNTAARPDDKQDRPVGDVQVAALNGFDDWQNLFYPFQTAATYVNGVAFPVQEPDRTTIEEAQRQLDRFFGNKPPTAADDTASTDEDQALVLPVSTLLANDTDPDGDPLTLIAAEPTSDTHGTVSLADGNVTYTPDPNYNGPASFTYSVSDDQGTTATATVNIAVNPVNDPPTAADDTATTDEDQALVLAVSTLLANDTDPDGDPLTLIAAEPTSNTHGTVGLADDNVTYTPQPNYNGPASFTYSVSDDQGTTATATVNITVNPVNDPPVCEAVRAAPNRLWPPNKRFRLVTLVGAQDPDRDPVTITLTTVTQDEPLGRRRPDARRVAAAHQVLLRAERLGNGDGRVYRVSFSASEGQGGTCSGTVLVEVPKRNRGPGSTPVESPLVVNSFGP